LSLIYHFKYEKPGILAQIEGAFAKLLFIYGVAQLFFAVSLLRFCSVLFFIFSPQPSSILFGSEMLLFALTLVIFIITNVWSKLYDPWHCLLHIIPSLWMIVVSLYHEPLFVRLLASFKK